MAEVESVASTAEAQPDADAAVRFIVEDAVVDVFFRNIPKKSISRGLDLFLPLHPLYHLFEEKFQLRRSCRLICSSRFS